MSEIVFENVGHRFGERTVLQQIDLRLSEQRIGIVGANGSGKSTLARMINGLVVPTEGHVHVNGLDTAKKGRDVRKQVGFVFTDPNHQIVMPTVAEDIEFSLRRSGSGKTERAAKVASVLERYGLAGHADHLISSVFESLDQQLIVVTHQLDLLESFERVLVVDQGRIVADGSPADSIDQYRSLVS